MQLTPPVNCTSGVPNALPVPNCVVTDAQMGAWNASSGIKMKRLPSRSAMPALTPRLMVSSCCSDASAAIDQGE